MHAVFAIAYVKQLYMIRKQKQCQKQISIEVIAISITSVDLSKRPADLGMDVGIHEASVLDISNCIDVS